MEINRKSWHWRLNCEYFRVISDRRANFKFYLEDEDYNFILSNYMGNTLCSYFWGTILRLFLTVLALVVIYMVSGLVTFALITGPIYTAIAQIQAGYFEFEPEYVSWTLLLILGISAGLLILKEKISETQGLVPEYIKARKNKFCPTLTVKK